MYAKWWAKYLTDKCLINVFIYPFKEEKDIYLPTQNLMRQHIHLIIIFQVIFLSPDMTNKVFFFSWSRELCLRRVLQWDI